MTKFEKAKEKFISVLREKRLLPKEGTTTLTTGGIPGEELIINKWSAVADHFIYHGMKLEVGASVQREYFNESFVTLKVYPKKD